MTEPIPPIAYRPPPADALAPVTSARRPHAHEREDEQQRQDEQRRHRHPAPPPRGDDDAPGEDGHVDVLA